MALLRMCITPPAHLRSDLCLLRVSRFCRPPLLCMRENPFASGGNSFRISVLWTNTKGYSLPEISPWLCVGGAVGRVDGGVLAKASSSGRCHCAGAAPPLPFVGPRLQSGCSVGLGAGSAHRFAGFTAGVSHAFRRWVERLGLGDRSPAALVAFAEAVREDPTFRAMSDAERRLFAPLVAPVLKNWNGIEVGGLRAAGPLAG